MNGISLSSWCSSVLPLRKRHQFRYPDLAQFRRSETFCFRSWELTDSGYKLFASILMQPTHILCCDSAGRYSLRNLLCYFTSKIKHGASQPPHHFLQPRKTYETRDWEIWRGSRRKEHVTCYRSQFSRRESWLMSFHFLLKSVIFTGPQTLKQRISSQFACVAVPSEEAQTSSALMHNFIIVRDSSRDEVIGFLNLTNTSSRTRALRLTQP
jgi:hypothetical protein